MPESAAAAGVLEPALELSSRIPNDWSHGRAVDWKPDEGTFDGLERDGQRHKGVPLLPCSFGPDPKQAAGDKGSVVSHVPVQH